MVRIITLEYDAQRDRHAYLMLRRRDVTERELRGLDWAGGPGEVYIAWYILRWVILLRATDYRVKRESRRHD